MNSISLCCTSTGSNINILNKMLESAQGFDEVILHINGNKQSNESYKFPNNVKFLDTPELLTAAEGFNFVISNASNLWVCPACDDDFFHSDKLSQLMSWFKTADLNGIDIIYFPIFCGNERDGYTEQALLTPTYDGLRKQNMLPFSCFYRKSLWDKIGGYNINLPFSDWHFWLKALKSGVTLYRWNNPIYYFRTGIEERLSDRERKAKDFELSKQQLLDKVDAYEF